MKATIIDINYGRDLYIFRREDDETGYFELLEGEDFEIDDVLVGDFTKIGTTFVRCELDKRKISIKGKEIQPMGMYAHVPLIPSAVQ